MGFAVTEPREKSRLTKPTSPRKSASGEFFAKPNRTRPANRRQPLKTQLGKPTYAYKIASGRPFWPSRDPIAESGGVNLYCFVRNNGINQWDLLGMSPDSSPNEEKEVLPPKPEVPDGVGNDEFNCAGLAFGTFKNMTLAEVQAKLAKCKKTQCDQKCGKKETKVWLWVYEFTEWRFLKKTLPPKPFPVPPKGGLWRKRPTNKDAWYVVAHPGECTKCYAKKCRRPYYGACGSSI